MQKSDKWTINNTPLTLISQVIFLIISDLKVMHRAIYFKNSNSTHWNCNEWSSNNSWSILQWSNLLYSHCNTSVKCPGMLHFVKKKPQQNHFCGYSAVNPSEDSNTSAFKTHLRSIRVTQFHVQNDNYIFQPHLVAGVSTHGRGAGWSLRSLPD